MVSVKLNPSTYLSTKYYRFWKIGQKPVEKKSRKLTRWKSYETLMLGMPKWTMKKC